MAPSDCLVWWHVTRDTSKAPFNHLNVVYIMWNRRCVGGAFGSLNWLRELRGLAYKLGLLVYYTLCSHGRPPPLLWRACMRATLHALATLAGFSVAITTEWEWCREDTTRELSIVFSFHCLPTALQLSSDSRRDLVVHYVIHLIIFMFSFPFLFSCMQRPSCVIYHAFTFSHVSCHYVFFV